MQEPENLTEFSEISVLKDWEPTLFLFVIHSTTSFYIGLVLSILLNMNSPWSLFEKVQLNSPYFPFFIYFSPKQLPTSNVLYLYIVFIVCLPRKNISAVFPGLFTTVSLQPQEVPGTCESVLSECAHAWLCGRKQKGGRERRERQSRGGERRGEGERRKRKLNGEAALGAHIPQCPLLRDTGNSNSPAFLGLIYPHTYTQTKW